MLAKAEIDSLHKGSIDLPAQRAQYLIDGLDRAKHHAGTHPGPPASPHGLDGLRIAQLGQWHPPGLGSKPGGLASGGGSPGEWPHFYVKPLLRRPARIRAYLGLPPQGTLEG